MDWDSVFSWQNIIESYKHIIESINIQNLVLWESRVCMFESGCATQPCTIEIFSSCFSVNAKISWHSLRKNSKLKKHSNVSFRRTSLPQQERPLKDQTRVLREMWMRIKSWHPWCAQRAEDAYEPLVPEKTWGLHCFRIYALSPQNTKIKKLEKSGAAGR